VTLMGGRAAEAITSSSISTGASDDLRRATDLAQRCVTEFGFNDLIGPVNVGTLANPEYGTLVDSSDTSSIVEKEVRKMCSTALSVAIDVINLNKDLHSTASALLEQDERLQGESLQQLLKDVKIPDSLREFVTPAHNVL